MTFSYLDEDNIFEIFEQSREYTEKLTEPFPEYSRIARNKPHPKTPKKFPKTTDGTTASIITKSPRRVVQQLPSGVIESSKDNDYWPILAEFIYRTEILPQANSEYDLIQKCWTTLENGQTFGAQAVYTPMISRDGKNLPDYLITYWGDIFYQLGKKSGYDCKYVFLRTWWQEPDVDKTISDEQERQASARADGIDYKPVWDINGLLEIKGAIVNKDDKSKTPSEDALSLDPSGIEIVTAFQVGVKSIHYTFNPTKKIILRRKENDDLRGKIPLDWYYYDTDGSNPTGRSLIEYVGPIQNLIDSDMQAYQYNRALALQPPMLAIGNVNTNRLSTAPGAVNKIQDVNARFEPIDISTTAIRDYPNIYGLQVSQLLKNTSGDPSMAISSEVGDPMAGKTPTAIKARNAATGTDDNAMRKGFEAFWENWSETAINLYIGSRKAPEDLQLDEETANKLRDLEAKGHLKAGFVRDGNIVTVDYPSLTEPLHFRVNAATSKVNTEAAQLEALQVLVGSLDSSASLSAVVPTDKKLLLWNAIVSNSGVEDSDDLKVSDEELAEMMQENAADVTGMVMSDQGEMMGGAGQVPDDEMMAEAAYMDDMPVEQPIDVDPDDILIANELRAIGVPESLIAEVPGMIDKGYSEDEIMASIRGVMSKEGANV